MNKEELLKLKNKEFAFACLRLVHAQKSEDEIAVLTNPSECKRRFDMNFPILQLVPEVGTVDKHYFLDAAGNRRYYPERVRIGQRRYIVCNDWYYKNKVGKRDTRTAFVEWVLL